MLYVVLVEYTRNTSLLAISQRFIFLTLIVSRRGSCWRKEENALKRTTSFNERMSGNLAKSETKKNIRE